MQHAGMCVPGVSPHSPFSQELEPPGNLARFRSLQEGGCTSSSLHRSTRRHNGGSEPAVDFATSISVGLRPTQVCSPACAASPPTSSRQTEPTRLARTDTVPVLQVSRTCSHSPAFESIEQPCPRRGWGYCVRSPDPCWGGRRAPGRCSAIESVRFLGSPPHCPSRRVRCSGRCGSAEPEAWPCCKASGSRAALMS